MNLDFVSLLYYRELDAKRDLDARPTIHVAVLTVLGSLLAYSVIHFTAGNWLQEWCFGLAFSAATVSYVVALVNVFRANLGHTYARLPLLESLHAYSKNLDSYFKQFPSSEDSASTEFEDLIRRRMIEATSKNEYANLSRAARHYSAVRAMCFCVGFALMAIAPVLWNSRKSQPTTNASSQRQPICGGAMADTERPTPLADPVTPTEPLATAPAKPAEPENIIFKGTQQPAKPRPEKPSESSVPKLKK